LRLLCGQYTVQTSMYFTTGNCWLNWHFNPDLANQTAYLSWYPPAEKYEKSGRNPGRWTQTEEADFLVREHRNKATESSLEGVTRGPQLAQQWKNSLRGSSDIHQAMIRINSQARAVIDNRFSGLWIHVYFFDIFLH
jgi:hypothetical protein